MDITKQPMEVGPTAHYVMGGVKANILNPKSRLVPGCMPQESLATGLHGANRLGGNSLSDLVTFGRRAAIYFESASAMDAWGEIGEDEIQNGIDHMMVALNREGGENPAAIVHDLREMMQEKVGIIRTREQLVEALDDLEALRVCSQTCSPGGGVIYNPGWHQALELEAMIDVSQMCSCSTRAGREPCGGHTRDDFPVPDHDSWGKVNSVITKDSEGNMKKIEHRSYPPIPDELKQLLDSDDLDGDS